MAQAVDIKARLEAALAPEQLVVRDDSHKHAGHAGANPAGGSHFHVEIVASKFSGLTRVARHQLIYAALSEEINSGLHALSIAAMTPQEYDSNIA